MKEKAVIKARIAGRNSWVCIGTLSKNDDEVWSNIITTPKELLDVQVFFRRKK